MQGQTDLDGMNVVDDFLDKVETYLLSLDGEGVGEVLAGVRHWRRQPSAPVAPRSHPCLAHLPAALSDLRQTGRVTLADAIEAVAPHLSWVPYDRYPEDEIGPAFAKGHTYALLIGEGAPVPADDFDFGLFIVAPGLFYRDHHHAAPELYMPLTGPHGWRFRPGDALDWWPAHRPVWNPSWQPHATKVGHVPLLCLYGWTRDVATSARVIPASDWPEIEAASPPAA
jgi:hypothetical protein